MTEPNEFNVPTNTPEQDQPLSPGRFDKFTDSERYVLSEALRELLQVKREAMTIANADLGSDPKNHFSEVDFGIPGLERLLNEVGDDFYPETD